MRALLVMAAVLLMSTTAWAGPEFLALVGNSTFGTITLNSDGTYTSTGPAVVTTELEGDGTNHYFTVTFPETVSSVSVVAAGASGAKWNTGVAGRGCIVTASVPVTGGASYTAKIGVRPPDNAYSGGYGGGRGADGSGSNGTAGGGGSTTLIATATNTILIEAGAGNGAAGAATGTDAIGDGGGTQDSSHGNRPGVAIGQGGGWTVSLTSPYPASSKIAAGSGSYATGASGNSGTGYMVITY